LREWSEKVADCILAHALDKQLREIPQSMAKALPLDKTHGSNPLKTVFPSLSQLIQNNEAIAVSAMKRQKNSRFGTGNGLGVRNKVPKLD
jgi:hypothetical protein